MGTLEPTPENYQDAVNLLEGRHTARFRIIDPDGILLADSTRNTSLQVSRNDLSVSRELRDDTDASSNWIYQLLVSPWATKYHTVQPQVNSCGLKRNRLLGGLLSFLMIISLFIHGLVSDRQILETQTVDSIVNDFGGSFSLAGPILAIPATYQVRNSNNRLETVSTFLYIYPNQITATGTLKMEDKRRGIFHAPLYQGNLEMEGSLIWEEEYFRNPQNQNLSVNYGQASILFLIEDPRTLSGTPNFSVDGETLEFRGGNSIHASTYHVLEAPFPISGSQKALWNFKVDFHGGKNVNFFPLGSEFELNLESDWNSPAFEGAYLPLDHTINSNGFNANWQIAQSAQGMPRSMTRDFGNTELDKGRSLTTRFFQPVGNYQMIYRSLQYAILFLLVPFTLFFLWEVFANLNLHPIQYLLTGIANLVFYVLFLSLSEYMSILLAYSLAASACSLLIMYYAVSVLKTARRGLLMLLALGLLYLFLYFVLQSEDYALILGSLMLFVLVAIVMITTRKIEWGTKKSELAPKP